MKKTIMFIVAGLLFNVTVFSEDVPFNPEDYPDYSRELDLDYQVEDLFYLPDGRAFAITDEYGGGPKVLCPGEGYTCLKAHYVYQFNGQVVSIPIILTKGKGRLNIE